MSFKQKQLFLRTVFFNLSFVSVSIADSMPNAVWLWDVSKLCLTAVLLQSSPVRGSYLLLWFSQPFFHKYRAVTRHSKRFQQLIRKSELLLYYFVINGEAFSSQILKKKKISEFPKGSRTHDTGWTLLPPSYGGFVVSEVMYEVLYSMH